MRLATLSTEKCRAFFAVELRAKYLRVAEAAAAMALSTEQQLALSSIESYLENLPKSEKYLRGLLQEITKNPRQIARPGSDGQPILIDAAAITEFHPPVRRPGKILCIGMNYRDHCEEQKKPIPKMPVVFNKFATSLTGAGQPIPLPIKIDDQCDYEAELAVVIGKKATNVTKRSAMKHVAGYTIMNDISLRATQKNEPQWARAKGFDGGAPIGPIIVTADEIPDPHALKIASLVNGETRQKSNTSNLIFDIPTLIQFITKLITLEPGDIISTGTPGGVGAYMDPPGFLKPGDEVEIRIERIGSLKNPCVAR